MADPTAPAPAQPEEDKVPLLRVLEDLGTQLGGADVPAPSNVQHVVGAIVKVMEHGGVDVADELWPPEPDVVARPETADAVHRQKTNERLDRVEGLLTDLHKLLTRDKSNGNGETSDEENQS
jgi:hypothetical protein